APAGERIEPGIGGESMRAPQRENRAADLLCRRPIDFVVLQVRRTASAIVLAHGMDAVRIVIGGMIMRRGGGTENIAALSSGSRGGGGIEKKFWLFGDQSLRKRLGQRQKCPVPGPHRHWCVDAVPHVPGGDNTEP